MLEYVFLVYGDGNIEMIENNINLKASAMPTNLEKQNS